MEMLASAWVKADLSAYVGHLRFTLVRSTGQFATPLVVYRLAFRSPRSFVVKAALVFRTRQSRAEDKEPFALIELGPAMERSIQEDTFSVGPSAAVEFPVIKGWLEIEAGISTLGRAGMRRLPCNAAV